MGKECILCQEHLITHLSMTDNYRFELAKVAFYFGCIPSGTLMSGTVMEPFQRETNTKNWNEWITAALADNSAPSLTQIQEFKSDSRVFPSQTLSSAVEQWIQESRDTHHAVTNLYFEKIVARGSKLKNQIPSTKQAYNIWIETDFLEFQQQGLDISKEYCIGLHLLI